MLSALVIDSNMSSCESVVNYLKRHNYGSIAVGNVDDALKIISGRFIDIVFLYVDDLDAGLDDLDTIIKNRADMRVVIIGPETDVASAVRVIKHGAYDFLMKPVNIHKLVDIMEEIEQPIIGRSRGVLRAFHKGENPTFADIICQSPVMSDLVNDVREYSKTNIRVLLRGPNGSGKGLFARAIHNGSLRKKRAFIEISCSAIPEYLFESELFGYERGAFTDAVRANKGLVELAHKGTMFLDEIGDMPLEFQAKLLKLIDDNRFYRIGGEKPIDVDVRFIAATNQDLKQRIKSGQFREDLYFRLAVAEIEMPSLTDRKEDIIPLAMRFIESFNLELGVNVTGISDDVKAALLKYTWPGNIRELKNYIERMMIIAQNDTLESSELPFELTGKKERRTAPVELMDLKQLERCHIVTILKSVKGNRNKTAEILGIARSTLFDKIRQHGIKPEEFAGG